MLTADHCARDKPASGVSVLFTAGDTPTVDQTRSVSSISTLGAPSTGSALLNGTDLAVLTLSEAVTNRLPFMLTSQSVVGDVGRMVGYGLRGDGKRGSVPGTAGQARRAAENEIDWHGGAKYCGTWGAFCTQSGSSNILSADFDRPDRSSNKLGGSTVRSSSRMTPFEGAIAPGDSGGPLLVLRDNIWMIAGVASGGSSWNSTYGAVSWWTGVGTTEARNFLMSHGATYWDGSPSAGFIEDGMYARVASFDAGLMDDAAAVPVPAAGLLLISALGATGLWRKRRRAAARVAAAA